MQPSERSLEVGAGDEADLLLAAAAAEPERMGEGEAGERLGVGAASGGRVEPLEVDVERGPVVERGRRGCPRSTVTSIGSPTVRQPWRTPMPNGASDPMRRGDDGVA